MTSAQGQWWRRLLKWADVIHADFQTVISRVQQNISTYPFCTAERMLRTVIIQNSRQIRACFPIKIDEVRFDRFCVRYDWWRRLQRTSSVSPVWINGYKTHRTCAGKLTHWDRDEINNISQTTFSNIFSSMKIFEFRLKLYWSLFPRF